MSRKKEKKECVLHWKPEGINLFQSVRDFLLNTVKTCKNTSKVHQVATCDVGGEPAAGLFCCKTFGDIFRCSQDLQR